MTDRNVTHATFTLERTYRAPRTRVFRAFSDYETKKKWFGGPATVEAGMDFQVGGREHAQGRVGEGAGEHAYRFDSVYLDIVPDERIIYAYDMDMNGKHISASLATIELADAAGGTRLKLTEQGAYLDGFDDPKVREQGTRDLLEAIARVVEA